MPVAGNVTSFRQALRGSTMDNAVALAGLFSSKDAQMQRAKIVSGARALARVEARGKTVATQQNTKRARSKILAEARMWKREQRDRILAERRFEREREKLRKQAGKCQTNVVKMRDKLANKLGEVTTLESKIENCENVIATAQRKFLLGGE